MWLLAAAARWSVATSSYALVVLYLYTSHVTEEREEYGRTLNETTLEAQPLAWPCAARQLVPTDTLTQEGFRAAPTVSGLMSETTDQKKLRQSLKMNFKQNFTKNAAANTAPMEIIEPMVLHPTQKLHYVPGTIEWFAHGEALEKLEADLAAQAEEKARREAEAARTAAAKNKAGELASPKR